MVAYIDAQLQSTGVKAAVCPPVMSTDVRLTTSLGRGDFCDKDLLCTRRVHKVSKCYGVREKNAPLRMELWFSQDYSFWSQNLEETSIYYWIV